MLRQFTLDEAGNSLGLEGADPLPRILVYGLTMKLKLSSEGQNNLGVSMILA
jgi:hypothetical protein